MNLLILCVVLRNYHDISTVCARARELIILDTEEDVIISPSSAGLVAATRAGQREVFLNLMAVEEAKRSPQWDASAWGAQGCLLQRGLEKWGSFHGAHHGHFPSFLQLSQPTNQWAL